MNCWLSTATSAGSFGAMMIEQSLAAADQAAMSGDVVAMIRAYEAMRGHK